MARKGDEPAYHAAVAGDAARLGCHGENSGRAGVCFRWRGITVDRLP